jgi:hypothetical protein
MVRKDVWVDIVEIDELLSVHEALRLLVIAAPLCLHLDGLTGISIPGSGD